MNRKGIEKVLRSTVDDAPVLPFEQLAAMPYVKMQEHDYITRQPEAKKAGRLRQLTVAASCCLLLLFLMAGWYIQSRVSSIITLDVNPGIEIKTNLREKVLSVRAINEDAKAIIGSHDYKGIRLEALVPILMNSLVEHQYINTDQNAILLSVKNKSSRKAENLRIKLDAAIRESLETLNIAPMILSQKLSKEELRAELAKKYGLSEGKMNLIQDLIAANSGLSLEKLAGKSIGQLYHIARENSVDLSEYFIEEEDNNSSRGNTGGATGEDTDTGKEPGDDKGWKDNQYEAGSESNTAGKETDTNNNIENKDSENEANKDEDALEQDQGENDTEDWKENDQGDRSGNKQKDKWKTNTAAGDKAREVFGGNDSQGSDEDYINGQTDEDSQGNDSSGNSGSSNGGTSDHYGNTSEDSGYDEGQGTSEDGENRKDVQPISDSKDENMDGEDQETDEDNSGSGGSSASEDYGNPSGDSGNQEGQGSTKNYINGQEALENQNNYMGTDSSAENQQGNEN